MLKKLYIKYVLGVCKSLCFCCKYKYECDVYYEEPTWKELKEIKKKQKESNRRR